MFACDVPPAAATFGGGVNPSAGIQQSAGSPALGRTFEVCLDHPLGIQGPGTLTYLFFSLALTVNQACGVPDDVALAGVPVRGQGLMHDTSGLPFVPEFALTAVIGILVGNP